jgi:hypothetical protein
VAFCRVNWRLCSHCTTGRSRSCHRCVPLIMIQHALILCGQMAAVISRAVAAVRMPVGSCSVERVCGPITTDALSLLPFHYCWLLYSCCHVPAISAISHCCSYSGCPLSAPFPLHSLSVADVALSQDHILTAANCCYVATLLPYATRC